MIFTTTAAICFAALTGMQSIQQPSMMNHQGFDVRPNYACEIASVEFTDVQENLMRYENLKASNQFPTKPRGGKKASVTQAEAEANSMYIKMMDFVYYKAGFDAKYMAFNSVYPTDFYGERTTGAMSEGIPEYNEFKFADDEGNRVTFIFTDRAGRGAFESSDNVFVNYLVSKNPSVIAEVWNRISGMYLEDMSYNKYFGIADNVATFVTGWQSTADCVLEAALGCEINDIGLETTFGPGSGGYSTNCWDWLYPIIDCIIYLHIIGYWEYTGIDLGAQITSINDVIAGNDVFLFDIEQGLETTFGPGSGGYSAMCGDAIVIADWIYNLIILLHLYGILEYNGVDLGAQITAINNGIEDVKMAAAYHVGNNDIGIGLIGGAGINYSLEMSDLLYGNYHLNQNVLASNIANASALSFTQFVANFNN